MKRGRLTRLFSLLIFLFPTICFAGPVDGTWDLARLNTASEADYLTDNEKAVVLEINKLRSDPAAYARDYLEPMLTKYQGRKLVLPGQIPIVTQEGAVALKDAISALNKARPVPLLVPDNRLTLAARDHARDQGKSGRTGHGGSDRSDPGARICRYGRWTHAMGENIFYGDQDARSVVLHLVIDDGIPGRGHRNNFLNEHFKMVGVASASHPSWRNVCVIDFAGGFDESKK